MFSIKAKVYFCVIVFGLFCTVSFKRTVDTAAATAYTRYGDVYCMTILVGSVV